MKRNLLVQFLIPILVLILTFILGERFIIYAIFFIIGWVLGVLDANIGWLNMIKKLK